MKNKLFLISFLCLIFSAFLSACVSPAQFSPETDMSRQPTATPAPTNAYKELSQEALATLIHETAVNLETAVNPHDLKVAIQATHGLIDVYAARYNEIAPETTNTLIVITADLAELGTRANEHVTSPETDQRVTALPLLAAQITQIQSQTGSWLLAVQTEMVEREKMAANTPPQAGQVAYNRIEAFIQAHDFLDAYATAFDDEKLSSVELAHLSQLGATAKASLYNTGDPQLMPIAQQINALSHQASRGEWQQAQIDLAELEFSLPARPRP